jgi:23S rRNA pseudouridine1911/1915/1917 synthase
MAVGARARAPALLPGAGSGMSACPLRRKQAASGWVRIVAGKGETYASLLYCDYRIAVFNKPPGISLATRRSEPDAAADRLVRALPPVVRSAHGLETGPFLLVHRLDVATTGLVLVARDEQTHRDLAGLLSRRLIRKTYLALVWGRPRPPVGSFDSPLGPDRLDRRRMKADPGGRPAISRYRTLARGPHVSLLALFPETGRTHQLRVHLANAGNWIVGDDLYGGARHRGVRDPYLQRLLNPLTILLHAWRLELPESSGYLPSRFEAPLPPHFNAAIKHLHMAGALPSWDALSSQG